MAFSPNTSPAYNLWIELATRITAQPLHYRAGDEEAAARSVTSLFQKTRTLLEANPEAPEFRTLGLELLNVVLRPYTSRWEAWMIEDKTVAARDGVPAQVFRDELTRRMFRAELREVREILARYKARLAVLAGISDESYSAPRPGASLGASVEAGIGGQVAVAKSPVLDGPDAVIKINAAEHRDILARRRILAGGAPSPAKLTDAAGLALSGGGIRSATYCMGIVQALVEKGLFPQFDYLSTVSGGGYFGTFLSCALGTNPAGEKSTGPVPPAPVASPTAQDIHARIEDVFHSQASGRESGLIRHLRNESKYLLNGGFVGRLRIAGLLFTGILWNMLMVLPLPLLLAWAVYQVADCWDFWGGALPAPVGSVWPSRLSLAGGFLSIMLCAVAGALLWLPFIQAIAHGRKPGSFWVVVQRIFVGIALFTGGLVIVALIVWVQPALFFYYEKLRAWFASHGIVEQLSAWTAPAAAGTGSVVLGLLATTLKASRPRLKALAAQLFILSGPVFFLFFYLSTGNQLGLGLEPEAAQVLSPMTLLVAAGFLALWSWFVVDINTLSPHDYYRDRLCDCYLSRRLVSPAASDKAQPARRQLLRKLFTGEFAQDRTESLQQVPLTTLGEHPAAPYHLINTTLNLPGSGNQELRGRAGDFFLVSKHFCGAPIVGYVPTSRVEEGDGHFDLGSAMAVSGAAASTSMGWKSLPNFRFLMTMLNVRLGYWLRWNSPTGGAGLWYFFQEMLASMNERGRFLNLSDGGHIENLGAYELLRRRCKFIVCVDGGEEPGMECADLTRLQRYADIDLGIDFEYGIADLSIQPNGFSRASAILVKIIYSRKDTGEPDELGWMIYLKLALTGIEPPYVLDYRRENPAFPHESTGDQIYDEAQFEAYRRLGVCAAENLFREELFGASQPATVRAWFQGLADNLLADNDPVFKIAQQAVAASGQTAPVAAAASAAVAAEAGPKS